MKLETLCLHGGTQPDPTTLSRAVPVYRTSSYVFRNAEHAANLFALKELGNIYTRLMNPTTDVLEKRVALLEGAPELGGLGVASGTSAVFYSLINLAQAGDNIVSARNLYGGTYTQFNDILPTLGIAVKFVDSNDPQNFARAIDDEDPRLVLRDGLEPGARGHRPRGRRQGRPRPRHPAHRGLDLLHALPHPAARARRGRRGAFPDEVVRRPRHGHRRGRRG